MQSNLDTSVDMPTQEKFINFFPFYHPRISKDICYIRSSNKETLRILESKKNFYIDEQDTLKYMLDNINLELAYTNDSNGTVKSSCYQIFKNWLQIIENENNNAPEIGFDTTDILIAILAFTGTGISWIVWDSQKHSPEAGFKICIGMINIFIFILFAASLYFSWVLAVQIILGILFFLFAIPTIIVTIYNVFNNREVAREDAICRQNYIKEHIPKMKKYLNQIKSKSEQDKNNESDKKNEKIENELGNTDNNFPAQKDKDKDKDKPKEEKE